MPAASPSGAQSRSSSPTSPGCSSPQGHSNATRYTAGCDAPGRRSSRRNDESGTDVSPRAGHPNVYRAVSASYIA